MVGEEEMGLRMFVSENMKDIQAKKPIHVLGSDLCTFGSAAQCSFGSTAQFLNTVASTDNTFSSENLPYQQTCFKQYYYLHGESSFAVPSAPCSSPNHPIAHHEFVFEQQLHALSPYVQYISRPIQEKLLQDDKNNSFNTDSFIIEIMEPSLVKLLTNHVEYAINSNILCMEEIYGAGKRMAVFSTNAKTHCFFAKVPPQVPISYYINRLVVYSNCSSSAFIVMLIYLDRVQRSCPSLALNEMNCHRLILSALVLAIKYLEDDVYLNSHYAFIGGISTSEMNDLELQFLELLGWNLNICRDLFDHFRNSLMDHSA